MLNIHTAHFFERKEEISKDLKLLLLLSSGLKFQITLFKTHSLFHGDFEELFFPPPPMLCPLVPSSFPPSSSPSARPSFHHSLYSP